MKHRHVWLDPIGSTCSTASTVLYVLASWLAWPVSLMAILINGYLYATSGLYADTVKECIYLCLSLYGWYEWLRGGKGHQPVAISHIPWRVFRRLMVVFLIGTAVSYGALHYGTSSKVPLWDASTTVLSLIAEWMVCRKYLQNWIVWGVVDALYIGLYLLKGLPAHALEMAIYVLVAAVGYWYWQRKMRAAVVSSLPAK